MKQLYKVLDADMTSPFQDFKYRTSKWYHCEDFDPDTTVDCSYGLYATDLDGLPYTYNTHRRVFACRVKGREVEYDQYKRRYEYMILDREVSKEELAELAKPLDAKLGYKLSEVLNPVDPREIPCPEITEDVLDLLRQWDSVGNSVWTSVWDSVWDSVGKSVWDSVWDSVGDSVRDSVWDLVGASAWDSVQAYIGSLFHNTKKWRYIDHIEGIYPFQAGADLWRIGLVPSFDGVTWRLHGGPDMNVVWEGKL